MNLAIPAALACVLLSACGSSAGSSATSSPPRQSPAATSPATPSPATPSLATPSDSTVTAGASAPDVKLIWSHIGTFFGEPQVWYVARVTNPADAPAYVTVDGRALDASGVIVGSNGGSLPGIPAHGSFDYFGYIGGGGALDTPLTGMPVKVTVKKGELRPDGWAPLLKTSGARLTPGDTDSTNTDARYSYNLSVVVANQTDQKIGNMVTQQVVLYDAHGQVVGGDTGSSDNKPAILEPGDRYREVWTGIPAIRRATSVQYSVWP